MTVIGTGTGRCGTQSLAKLLDKCQYFRCTHERFPHMPYEFDTDIYERWKQTFTSPNQGDVALYHGWHLERYAQDFPDAKFIVMRRNKDDVVESFLSLTEGTRNHWHDPVDDGWDTRFPTYNHLSKAEAIAQYWEDYYAHIKSLDIPILMVELEEFNSKKTHKEIFDWCEIPEKDRWYGLVHTNHREHHVEYRRNNTEHST